MDAFIYPDFDAPTRQASKPTPAPPDPQVIAKARAEGLSEGRRAAETAFTASAEAAQTEEAEARAEALAAAAATFGALGDQLETAVAQVERTSARLVAACLQRAIPQLSDTHAAARAERFVGEVLRSAGDGARLVLRTGSDAAVLVEEALSGHNLVGVGLAIDPDLPPLAVDATWGAGSAFADPAEETALLEATLERALIALSDPGDQP